MAMKNDAKFEFELTFQFKTDMRNSTNFELKSIEELFFQALESYAKLEEKVTCGLENDMRNLTNIHWSTEKSLNWDFHEILLSKTENVQQA